MPVFAAGAVITALTAGAVMMIGDGQTSDRAADSSSTNQRSSTTAAIDIEEEVLEPESPSTKADTVSSTVSTTSISTSVASTTTSTTTLEPLRTAGPILHSSGLGIAAFGDDVETAISSISSFFGPPGEDSGWVPSFGPIGTCPGEKSRLVQWSDLAVIFIESGTAEPSWGVLPGQRMWGAAVGSYDGAGILPIFTIEGIGIGSSVADLKATYRSTNLTYDDWFSTVTGDTYHGFATEDGVRGWTTGSSASDVVRRIVIGGECGE
jgi:hypothetical protein